MQGTNPKVELESPFAMETVSEGSNGFPEVGGTLREAGQKILASRAAAKSFRTLRDLKVDWIIPPSALETVGKLGEGAFASVDKAWYAAPDGSRTMVAVKRLKPEILAKPVDYELFVDECQLMKKLKHKNIVNLVGVGELETATVTNAYMVQEFMGGGTLKHMVTQEMLLNGRRGYSDVDAISICLQMAEGLDYLHSCHPMVIHRDLKLENVLLGSPDKVDGQFLVKLADFGLSTKVTAKMQRLRSMRGSTSEGLPMTASAPLATDPVKQQEEGWNKLMRTYSHKRSFSQQNMRLPPASSLAREPSTKYELTGQTGSLMYMSPEVFNQQRYNEKADVFSFGMMMYEVMQRYVTITMVSLKGTWEELYQYAGRVAAGYRPPINPKLPQRVIRVIQACWATNPSDRPSMAQVVAQLQQALEDEQQAAAARPPVSDCSCCIC